MGITNTGKAAAPDLLGGVNSIAAFDYLAVGDDNTAFAATQTALGNEITGNGLARAQVTPTLTTTTVADDTLQLSKTWTVTGTETVKEAGVFNAAASGTMAARTVLGTARSLANGDSYTYTYQIVHA